MSVRDRLIIAEQEIDLAPDTVITYTSQLNDIGELKNQKSNLTNQFKVPKTKNNTTRFESAELVQSATLLPYRKTAAIIRKSGIQIIPKGLAIIESADKFYNVTVYSGNIDLFDRIKNKYLTDLDLSAFDHTFDFTTVVNSRTNVYTDGYKYPIINYGKLNNLERTVKAYNLRPAPFVLMLLNKIFEEADLDIEYSDLVQEKLGVLLLPYTIEETTIKQDVIDNNTFEVETAASPEYTYNVAMIYVGFTSFPTVGQDIRRIPLDTIVSDPGAIWETTLYEGPVANASRQKFTSVGDIHIVTNAPPLTFSAVSPYTQGFSQVNLLLQRNGITIEVTGTTSGSVNGNFTFNWTTLSYQFNQGDIITLKVSTRVDALFKKSDLTIITDNASYDVTIDEGFSFSNELEPITVYGGPVTLAATLPKIKQSDFVKAFLQITCGILKTDSLEGKVYWKSFQDIADSTDFAVDWSDKLDMKSERHTAYRHGSYGQNNNLLYEIDDEDTDVNPAFPGLGNGMIEIDDDILPDENDLVELPFAATLMQKMLIDLDVPLIRKIIDTSTDEFTRKTMMRVLIDDTQDIAAPDLTYEDEDSNTLATDQNIPLCYFILPSETYHLGFSSLIEIFFRGLRTSLEKAKIKNESFLLDAVDITILDHFIPVWIQQFGAFFYLNKVSNWKNGESPTKCEIIRL